MLRDIGRRVAQMLPVIAAASVIVFLVLRLVPGDPARLYAGSDASDEVVEAVRSDLGLDRALPIQYVMWLGRVLTGDLGRSYISGIPVTELLWPALLATVELATAAIMFAVIIGVPTGFIAALRPRSPLDMGISTLNSLMLSIPNFWVGIMAILLFSVRFDWLPPGGRPGLLEDPVLELKALILPACVLGMRLAAVLSRFVRGSVLEVLNEDYVRTARAKGLSGGAVMRTHVTRNASIPVITTFGIEIGRLLGGAVIVETVFAWPGMGRLMLQSVTSRDYLVVQAALLVLVFAFLLTNLVVDILYGVLDPRVRLGRSER